MGSIRSIGPLDDTMPNNKYFYTLLFTYFIYYFYGLLSFFFFFFFFLLIYSFMEKRTRTGTRCMKVCFIDR